MPGNDVFIKTARANYNPPTGNEVVYVFTLHDKIANVDFDFTLPRDDLLDPFRPLGDALAASDPPFNLVDN